MALRRNNRRTRRATDTERRRAQDAGQTVPTYVYRDGSPVPDSGDSDCSDSSSSSYDSGSSSSSYDSGGSSGYSSYDSGSSYSSGSYDSGSSSCDSGGGGF